MTLHFFRTALALSAFALTPGLASAGPIGWGYTAYVRTTTGLGVLNLGERRLTIDPSGNGTGQPVSRNYVVTAPLPASSMSGESFPHDWLPSGDTRLFSVGMGYSVDPVATAPASDAAFRLTFTLTDKASGQEATIDFDGYVGASTTDGFPPSVLFTGGFDDPTRSFTLGGNRYRVTAVGGTPDEVGEPAVMGVNVMATANTPEPATLAMAGLGLAGVGLFRCRTARRSIPDSGR